jgi:hypothetical protein
VYTCMHWVGTIVVAVIAALRHATPPTASPRLACRSPSILNPQSHEQVVLSIRFVVSFHPPFTRFGQILTFPAYTTTPSPSQYPLVTQHIDLFRTHHPIPSRSTRQSTMPRWIPISLSIFPTSSPLTRLAHPIRRWKTRMTRSSTRSMGRSSRSDR